MKTAVIYARYSSDRQTEQSIDGQIHVCMEYAERNDIVIVGTYIDRAMTGTNDNREQFQKMLKDSDKKPFDYVLVYKLDRFSRNKYEMAIHRKHLKDNGIKVLSAMENIPDTPEGILLESLLEGMNQYYSEELSQKTLRGLRETRIKGNFPGGIINFGYRVKNHKVVIQEEEAAIIQELFTRYANGERLFDLVRDLNGRGVLNKGKPFSKHALYYLLENEKYTGIYTHDGITYDNIYPAIVSKNIFEIVKQRILSNKYGKHVIDVKYLLKGRAFCGYCGKPLHSATGTSSNGTIWRYYKCHSIKRDTGCQNRSIKKDALENAIIDVLTQAITSKKNFPLLMDGIINIHKRKIANDTEVRILEKELQKTTKALGNLLTAIEAGIFTDTTKARLQELEVQKKDLEEKLIIEKNKVKISMSRSEIESYLRNAIKQKSDVLIDMLVEKVVVFNEKAQIHIKYSGNTPPDDTHKDTTAPDGNDPDRGLLILSKQFQIIRKVCHGWRGIKANHNTGYFPFTIELYV